MAFNLDKNDEPKKSKFDLSKSEETTPDFQEPKKSNNTLYIIIALVVVGVGGYFYMKSSSKETPQAAVTTSSDSAAVTSADSSVVSVDSTAATNASTSVTESSAAASAPATFTKGSAEVVSVDDSQVSQVLDHVKSNPSAVITVEGYASSEGDPAFNDQLSQSRATNFVKYLVSKGVKAENIKAVGKGTENPVASNDDEAGRAKNRRVEIKY